MSSIAAGLSRLPPLFIFGTILAACGSDEAPASRGSGTGAGAVQVVDNAQARWAAGEEWTVADQPALEIGGDERAEYQFHAVAGAARLSDGRIAVADGGSSQVRLFSPEGTLITAVGRRGAGPEEFGRLAKLFPLAGDSLLVFDAGNSRLAVLGPNGGFARVANVGLAGPGTDLVGVLNDGLAVLRSPLPLPPSDGLARDSVLYLLVSRDGARVDSLGVAAGGQRFQHRDGNRVARITVPFGPAPAATAHGEHVFIGATDEYAIRQFRAGRGPVRTIRRRVSTKPFTEAHFNQFLEDFPQFRAALQQVPRPAHLPAFSTFIADRAGNLWVQDYPSPNADLTAWTVFDADGVMLGNVPLPAGFRPTDIGDGYLLGVWAGDLGVEQIRLYRLQKRN